MFRVGDVVRIKRFNDSDIFTIIKVIDKSQVRLNKYYIDMFDIIYMEHLILDITETRKKTIKGLLECIE